MALDAILRGVTSGTGAEVAGTNQLKVIPETNVSSNPSNVGAIRSFSENDPGAVTGSPYLKSPETGADYRLRVGVDTVLFTDTFNATAQNTAVWKHAFTTMTMTQSAGFLNINAAGTSTVSANYAYLQTWKHFPLIGTAPLAVEFTGALTSVALQANEVYQFGLGVAQAAADPVDGAWFELTSAGLYGVMRYNSGVATKQLLSATARTLGQNYKYSVVVGEREIEFWIDDVFYGEMSIPAGQSQPFLTTSLPVFIQKYNNGTVGSSPSSIFKMGDITVSLMDLATYKPWSHQMAGQGYSHQGQNGGTMGSNSFFTNSALPTTGLPVNTALTTNLPTGVGGGRGLATLWNIAATDMVLSQGTNPAGGVNQTPRTLFITGVTISAVSATAAWTAPAAGAHSIMFGIYWGSSAVTLAQSESGSFTTATVKAFRRKFLGFMNWATGATAIGTPPDRGPISVTFDSPIVVNPGENVGIFAQMHNGAATATGGLLFTYDFDHYYQ
jgi:hypothetical protein